MFWVLFANTLKNAIEYFVKNFHCEKSYIIEVYSIRYELNNVL